jgi:uncharacterized protein YabN with tetrapyrrole methylase and pyrophosphatase domain
MRQLLSVIGCGVKGWRQVTLEALRQLASADRILTLSLADHDVRTILAFVGNKPFVSLDDLYHDGAVDRVNYDRIVARVIAESNVHDRVALMVYGHPRVGVSFLSALERHCGAHDITFRVVTGISSFDTMIDDLGRDALEPGSVIIDANRLLLRRIELDSRLDHYIYHVCSVGVAATNYSEPSLGNRLDLLRDHLLRYFPPSHEALLLSSAVRVGAVPRRIACPIGELERLLPALSFDSSLYLSGVRSGTIDRDFLDLLQASSGESARPRVVLADTS